MLVRVCERLPGKTSSDDCKMKRVVIEIVRKRM